MPDTTILADGLHFGEGPRWHAGRLWFSDFYDHAVKSLGLEGDVRTEVQLDDQPSGLGWLPDGRLLIVSMKAQKLLSWHDGTLREYADLSGIHQHLSNDMVVDALGRAWVGDFGFDLHGELHSRGAAQVLADHPVTTLARVDPDGSVHRAAPDMHFPNGSVVLPDGKTLVVAETLISQLTAFDIGENGVLENRRVWAATESCVPDGIAMDFASGAIWVANALAPQCVLIAEGGKVLRSVTTSQNCYACAVGGERADTLFCMTAVDSDPGIAATHRHGKVEVLALA